jgi:RimJ/RimL family protein N-acetyltransferase
MRLIRHETPEAFLRGRRALLNPAARPTAGLPPGSGAVQAQSAAEPLLLATVLDQRDGGNGLRGATVPCAGIVAGACRPAIADALAMHPNLQGVVGRRAACEAYARAWRRHTGRRRALRFHMRDYALTALVAPRPVAGAARPATETDAPILGEWMVAFGTEARVPDDPQRMRAMVPRWITDRRLWLWGDGDARAMLGVLEVDAQAARIAPVYTPPEQRNRGYASALVGAVVSRLLDRGKRVVYLTADLANPTSNAIYARLGFRAQGDQYHFDFIKPQA